LSQPKVRKPGRPKLAKDDAKARIVPVRFNPELLRRVESAAKASGKNVSEWIRSTLDAATN
jgi:predicted HicB family RNase H-like nuclease